MAVATTASMVPPDQCQRASPLPTSPHINHGARGSSGHGGGRQA